MIFVAALLLIPIAINLFLAESSTVRNVTLVFLLADIVFLVVSIRRAVQRGKEDDMDLELEQIEQERFETNSLSANATIRSIEPDGSRRRFGGVISIGITMNLTVQPDGRAPFDVTRSVFISEIHVPQYQPGKSLQMKYLPEDPEGTAQPVGNGISVG